MNLALSSFGSPNYFVPASGAMDTVDYRGGLVRELSQQVQRTVRNLSAVARAIFSNIYEPLDILSGSAREDAYAVQFKAIDRFRAVPTNWSINPVEPPNEEQTDAARLGLLMLFVAGVPAPKVMLLNDGTFASFWRSGEAYASIDFDADREFPWSTANGLEVTSGTWTGGQLPAQLRAVVGA